MLEQLRERMQRLISGGSSVTKWIATGTVAQSPAPRPPLRERRRMRFLLPTLLRVNLPLVLLTAVCVCSARVSLAERPDTPIANLLQAPFQLEVTVLSVEHKHGPHSGESIWHRVHVDRVITGPCLNPGDETAIVSVRRNNAPGTTGNAGDRGLPKVGDKVRVFASGNANVLQSVPPNGWQPLARRIAFLAADETCTAERTMPFLASLIDTTGVGVTSLHFAAEGNGFGDASTHPQPAAKGYLSDHGRLRSNTDALVLGVRDLRPQHNTSISLDPPLRGGVPLVAFRSSIQTFAGGPDAAQAKSAADFARQTFGTVLTATPADKTATRIWLDRPELATHPILSGISIPPKRLVMPSRLLTVEPLSPDCVVLLWGEPVAQHSDAQGTPGQPNDRLGEQPGAEPLSEPNARPVGSPANSRQPVLWTRELALPASKPTTPRSEATTTDRDAASPSACLPRRRIAVTTLGEPADFALPQFKTLAVNMIAWAIEQEAAMSDADRKNIASKHFNPD